jgi:hypothetical protein
LPRLPWAGAKDRGTILGLTLLLAAGWWFWNAPRGVEIREFVLRPYATTEASPSRETRPWFAEIELEQNGYLLLVHLDESGWPTAMFPIGGAIAVAGGERLRLPDPDRGVAWTLGPAPRTQDFLAAATSGRNVDFQDLIRELEREAGRAPTPEESRARVIEVLEARMGPVSIARLDTGSS